MDEDSIALQCRGRIEALGLDVTDSRVTYGALQWGMEILSRIGSGRVGSRESAETLADYDASSGSTGGGAKRRALGSLADHASKVPRLDSTSREMDLKEFLKMVEDGELGDWIARRVSSNTRSLDARALVTLIDHCLLLSLDQSPCENMVVDGNHLWLHAVMVREVLGLDMSTNGDENLIEFPELDWLLAYFTASKPEYFLQALIDFHVKEFRSRNPSIVPYARQAGILEFAALRVPELIVPAMMILMQGNDGSDLQYKVHAWAVQSAVCPLFLSRAVTALVSIVDLETLGKYWKTASFSHVSLPALWTGELDFKVGLDGCHTKAWFCMLVLKHWEKLSPAAAEIVVLLSKVNLLLLDCLNKKLSVLVLEQATGNPINCSFLQSLLQNKDVVWAALFSRPLASCQCCPSEPTSKEVNCRKCYPRDVFLQTCQIMVLASDDEAAAEFLARICACGENAELLPVFVTQTQMLGALGKGRVVLKLWAKKVADRLQACDSTQLLKQVMALRQLLDSSFWSSHVAGTWKASWENVCEALNDHWLALFALLHRDESSELALSTLNVLQSLSMVGSFSSEVLARHLKGALGFLFHLLKKMDDIINYSLDDSRWNFLREASLLRKIIAHLAALCPSSFTLMVNILLNFSFEAGIKRQLGMASNNDLSKVEHLMSKPGFQTTIALASGTVDRYGRMDFLLPKQDNGVKNAGVVTSNKGHAISPNGDARKTQVLNPTFTEICGLLVQCFSKSAAKGWRCHPVDILEALLVNRLETPHEISITMEQYEEVLPKHVAHVRHTFLTECFHQNPFLFKILELVMEHGKTRQLEACAEFVRALLADSISKWHGAFRRQQTVTEDKSGRDRMQLFNIIQLVTSAQWLPQPLASCGEIISLISTEDVTTLLLIIWRCMHNELASAKKQPSEAKPEELKDSPGRDWETQFLSILRHNVSRIGAHFVRLYPQHKLVMETSSPPVSKAADTDQTGNNPD